MGLKDVICTPKEIDLKTCTFSKPELVGEYRKSCMMLNDHKCIIIQTPKLTLKNMTEHIVELLISRNRDRNREFYHMISHLEDIATTTIARDSKEWFGNNITKEQIEQTFKSSLQSPLKIDDPFIFKIMKTKDLNIEPNYQVVCLLQIDGIIFGRSSSKLDMKIIHAKFVKSEFSSDVSTKNMATLPYYNDGVSVSHSIYTSNTPVSTSTKEQALKDQALKDQALKDQALKEQALKDQALKDQALKDQALKEQALKDQALKDQALKDQALKEQALKDQLLISVGSNYMAASINNDIEYMQKNKLSDVFDSTAVNNIINAKNNAEDDHSVQTSESELDDYEIE
jgi:hypothetical protein